MAGYNPLIEICKSNLLHVDEYSEYLRRNSFEPANRLHKWLAYRVLKISMIESGVIPHESLCLEIGSALGRGVQAARALGFKEYIGIEPNKVLAEYCRKSTGANIFEDALPNLTHIKTESAELVFSIHVLEHAPTYKDALVWVKEMLRVTKVGGTLLIAAPDIRDYKEYFWDSDWTHGFPTSPRRISQMIEGLGAKVAISSKLHFGSLSYFASVTAYFLKKLFPTRLIDVITMKVCSRPLASGFNFACIYGLSFVLVKKVSETKI